MEVKEAIQKAFEYAKDYEQFLAPGKGLSALRLEEVDYNDKDDEWRITLGFDTGQVRKRASGAPLLPETITQTEREFRTFVLYGQTGEMKKLERG
ncbi:hypothetical protein [Rhodovibrio sodomensis]|uniref:hypothetical protein n=1 Tax=Rhodovibrio sodomensis TaxID=1088 RepID=UPI001905C611|nr:hypothetical protein [Rhodovibrio sodomensis]